MDALTKGQQRLVAILRIAVGTIFLSAGIEKFFLTEGGFSAAGFLKFGTSGSPILATPVDKVIYNPTHGFWVSLAGNADLMAVVNTLVVFGQLAIGVALILGLATRFASIMGTLMMVFFFLAAWDFEFGLVNQHLTYALITATLGYLGAGRVWGLDGVIEKMRIVRQTPQLRYVLG
ncbi:MAG: DoxX family protein [Chloroflexota bacterium]